MSFKCSKSTRPQQQHQQQQLEPLLDLTAIAAGKKITLVIVFHTARAKATETSAVRFLSDGEQHGVTATGLPAALPRRKADTSAAAAAIAATSWSCRRRWLPPAPRAAANVKSNSGQDMPLTFLLSVRARRD